MNQQREAAPLRRRDLLGALTAGVALATAAGVDEAGALPDNVDKKRKARYRANSLEVQAFYRVNRYPPK